jgi:hypothetical protein
MATSVRGYRALHSRKRPNNLDPESTEYRDVQAPGNVYVTSPCFFPHAVHYPQCDWEERVIAIQARFLLEPAQRQALDKTRDGSVEATAHWLALSLVLATCVFQLPDLASIERILSTLE